MRPSYEKFKYDNGIPVFVLKVENLDWIAHWHNDIELIYVLGGSIRMGVNDSVKILEAGDMAVVSSGNIHFYDSSAYSSETILVIFDPQFIHQPLTWPGSSTFESPFISEAYFKNSNAEQGISLELKELFLELLEEAQNSSPYLEYFYKGALNKILGLMLRYLPRTGKEKPDSAAGKNILLFQEILDYLDENHVNDISLESTAAVFFVSSSYFSKLFKKLSGKTFKDYLNCLRIEKAVDMLSGGTQSVSEIAFSCGFGSIRNFNRVFKKVTGKSPVKYMQDN